MKKIDASEIIANSSLSTLKIDCRECVDSTNTLLVEMADNGAEDGTVIIAEKQTGGRGRFDRVFYSPESTGVYFSVLLRRNFSQQKLSVLTAYSAVAAALAIDEFTDKEVKIKWVNDIYIDDKKVCGILAESSYNAAKKSVDYVVIGFGINVFVPKNGFPKELENKAGFITENIQADIRSKLIGRVLYYLFRALNEWSHNDALTEYQHRSYLDGKKVDVTEINRVYPAEVIGVDSNMNLIVKLEDESVKLLNSGEVSIRAL